jgi:uncharacterized protein YabE (DUF348 family)
MERREQVGVALKLDEHADIEITHGKVIPAARKYRITMNMNGRTKKEWYTASTEENEI